MSSLKLVNLKKCYGNVEVLHGIDLNVEPGEFIVVVGPSGCGKSSLLRMVAGLEHVTSGEIYISERLVNQVEPKARDIAMVFQNYALYPHMTVYKNMAYGLRMRRYSKEEIKERVLKAATLLQLTPLLERRPSELSGGQRQRVAMGRAIVRNPVIFLFDEPLSNLDTKLRSEMRLELKKLQQRLNITCLYVTHDQTEAMTMADRIVILNRGSVEQVGTPHDVYHFPKTKFVAGFMGNTVMNFIEPTSRVNANYLNNKTEIALPLSNEVKDKEISIGIRPEDVVIDELAGVKFTVDMVEALGPDSLLHGYLSDEQRFTVRCNSERKVKVGDHLALQIDEKKVHVFDKQTGGRL